MSKTRREFIKLGMLGAYSLTAIPYSWATTGVKRIDDDSEYIARYLQSKEPVVWLFAGDSITQGAKHTHGWRSYPEVFAERIRWELGRPRDVVINMGVSGNTTRDLLLDFDWRVARWNPQVVSVMMGTNDCATSRNVSVSQYEANMKQLIGKIRGLGAVPILHVPTPIILEKAGERQGILPYIEAVRNVAINEKTLLVDHWNHWQSAMDEHGQKAVYANWLNDPLHPNGHGHLEMARQLFKELNIFDPSAPTCGAPYYEGEH